MYVVTGILQAFLLSLAIVYFFRRRREEQERGEFSDVDGTTDDEEGAESPPSERTRLLVNGQRQSNSLPVKGTQQRNDSSQRQLSMLYAATPPEHDSDRSSPGRN